MFSLVQIFALKLSRFSKAVCYCLMSLAFTLRKFPFFRACKEKLKIMLVKEGLAYQSNSAKGQIQVIFGPMFSGKTTELIRRLRRYQVAKHKCLIIKYANDLRYDSINLATHDRQLIPAVTAMKLSDLASNTENYSVIGIDEGQFFSDIVPFTEDMANKGKIVIVAALDGTFQRKSFGSILKLVPLAESVIKLTAVCMLCFEEASFTKRIGNETKIEIIGGEEKYMAVCRKCYNLDHTSEKENSEVSSNIPVKSDTCS